VPDEVWYGLAFLIEIEAIAFVLNSLPVPPFDGYGFIEPWLPTALRTRVAAVSGVAMWLVFLALWTLPGLNHALWTAADAITSFLLVSPRMADIGQATFQKNSGWLMIFILGFLFLVKRGDKKAPQAVSSADEQAQQLYQTAKQLLAQNQPVDAVDALNKAVSVKQDFARAWQLRGVCFGLMNRNDEALQNFDHAIKLDPLLADAWYNRACLHALQGNYDAALGDLSQAVKLSPDSIKPYAKQDPSFLPLRNDARFALLTS
jgi:tetratricopeptide (TPR) repeat protein